MLPLETVQKYSMLTDRCVEVVVKRKIKKYL